MQNGRDADPGAKMLGVGGDPDHRIRARPHQQVVDLAFVLKRNVGDLLRQREDEVEIPHLRQFGLARFQPCLCRTRLTFWTVPVPTRVVGNVVMATVFTPRDMTAESRNFTPIIVWLRVQILVPLSIRCCWKSRKSSGVAVSGERSSQAANRLQARKWLACDAGPRLRADISAIMRARRGVIGLEC